VRRSIMVPIVFFFFWFGIANKLFLVKSSEILGILVLF